MTNDICKIFFVICNIENMESCHVSVIKTAERLVMKPKFRKGNDRDAHDRKKPMIPSFRVPGQRSSELKHRKLRLFHLLCGRDKVEVGKLLSKWKKMNYS